jgi:hypothetical protein
MDLNNVMKGFGIMSVLNMEVSLRKHDENTGERWL